MFFNLSLHRSATTSTAQVFRDCGLTVCDWVGWDFEQAHDDLFKRGRESELTDALMATFPQRDYYGDLPVPLLHTELISRFPDACFFMVLRDVDAWVESSFQHVIYTASLARNPTAPDPTPANRMMLEHYGQYEAAMEALHSPRPDEACPPIWRTLFHKHLISVFGACNERRIPLRLFYLSDPRLGDQLVQLARPGAVAAPYTMARHHSNDRGRDGSKDG